MKTIAMTALLLMSFGANEAQAYKSTNTHSTRSGLNYSDDALAVRNYSALNKPCPYADRSGLTDFQVAVKFDSNGNPVVKSGR